MWADSIVRIVPGARYGRSGLSKAVLGAHYRDLWTTPIEVPVVNLRRFAGGLTLLSAHAGSQTRSLRFAARDGRTYQFRTIDKDPTARLTDELRHSIAGAVLQDGVSASHPAASLVASALLEAVGVLHVKQTVVVMPDDIALGTSRTAFAGMLGMIEERPDDTEDRGASFGGGGRVVSPDGLFKRLDRTSREQVDAPAFLRARLVDIFIGDRDRHRDQFRWLATDSNGTTYWQPISRDHDEAFVKLDGAALALVRLYYLPLISFGATYPAHDKLNWHAREIDRRFLVGLDRTAWDTEIRRVQEALSDSVIDAAVAQMPAAMHAIGGSSLAQILKARRDGLPAEALSYYAFLAAQVELRGTNAADVVEVRPDDTDGVLVTMRPRGQNRAPYLQRHFPRRETRELRVLLWNGADSIIIHPLPGTSARLRVVGGDGADVIVDSTRAGQVQVYDVGKATTLVRPFASPRMDRRPYPEWTGSDLNRYPPRDWGVWQRPVPVLGANSDVGVVVGAGFVRTHYGFRQQPYASEVRASLGYATAIGALRANAQVDIRRPNSSAFVRARAVASGFDFLRYFGEGNDRPELGGRAFHTLRQTLVTFEPRVGRRLGSVSELSIGPSLRWMQTRGADNGFVSRLADSLYGVGHFGAVGVGAHLERDTRDEANAASTGTYTMIDARAYPRAWDARSGFTVVRIEWRAYRTFGERPEVQAQSPLLPTLAARVGGQRNLGRFPFQESAFIGGSSSVRGLLTQRFAGDASLFGSLEARMPAGHTTLIMPIVWGTYSGVDAGRVWADGLSRGGWHSAVVGGLWMSVLERANTLRIGAARSRERLVLEAGFGLGF